MKILDKITDVKKEFPSISIALGMFDGMHLGHQSIVNRAIELSKEISGVGAALTFKNHPLTIIDKEHAPLAIATSEIRRNVLQDMGVELLIEIPFTKELSRLSPLDFLALLRDNLAPKYIVVGKNFTFGYGGKGTGKMLVREGENYGFIAEICPTVRNGNKPISSTRIRALIKDGNLSEVNNFLGRPLSYIGKVISGDKRGRTIGFPTANLKLDANRAMLPNGAYAAKVKYRDKIYNAIVNIGNNPTFNGKETRLEAHILDFSKNIYDENIEIMFLAKLREEKRFADVEELKTALKNDIENAKKTREFQI